MGKRKRLPEERIERISQGAAQLFRETCEKHGIPEKGVVSEVKYLESQADKIPDEVKRAFHDRINRLSGSPVAKHKIDKALTYHVWGVYRFATNQHPAVRPSTTKEDGEATTDFIKVVNRTFKILGLIPPTPRTVNNYLNELPIDR